MCIKYWTIIFTCGRNTFCFALMWMTLCGQLGVKHQVSIIMTRNVMQQSWVPILQGHNGRSNPQKLTVSSISPEVLNILQTNLVQWGFVWSHCCVTILDCCLQGHGHFDEGSNPQRIFVWTISSEQLNLSLWNLVWWCIIVTWSVMGKGLVAISRSRYELKS